MSPRTWPVQLTDRMRLNCFMETGDERYNWLNDLVVIASSARCGNQGVSGMMSSLLAGLKRLQWCTMRTSLVKDTAQSEASPV